ncbi:DUF6207 family protein [Streptomyces coeruleorubidus]|uniref:DUF6207 family protein n=1 Tax=Streptomyces coeruleorubidus TaxID=116188 RepID=UPI00378A033B
MICEGTQSLFNALARHGVHEADQRSAPAGPGLAVVEVAAADDQSAFAVWELLAGRWATAPADRTTPVPGEPGVMAGLVRSAAHQSHTGSAVPLARVQAQFARSVPHWVGARFQFAGAPS